MKTDQPFSIESTLLRCRDLATFCAQKGSTEVKLDIRDFNNLMSLPSAKAILDEFRTHGADSAIDDEMPEIRGHHVTFVSHDEFAFPAETVELVRKAIGASKARDDEGEFPTLWDHLDYSGENKAVTVTRQAALDALAALGRENLIDPRLARAAKDGEWSLLLDMQQECISLRVALATARDHFKDYERQHRAKGTPDADAKAETNKGMVAMCQAAIDRSRQAVPSVEPDGMIAVAVVKTVEAARDAGMLSSRLCSDIADATPGVSVER